MPVYKDKKRNSWYVDYKIKNFDGTFTHVKKRGFATKHEAQLAESKLKLDSSSNIHKATFRELLELQYKSIDSTPTTIYMKTHWLDKHFPYMDKPLYKISREDFLSWRNSLKDKGLATRTINRGIGYVKSVCAFANKLYIIPDNSIVMNSYKLQSKDKEEMDVWTVEEFNSFIECIDNPTYKAFFSFLYWTGCRRGEAIALTKSDIKGNIVNINKSIRNYVDGIKEPKTAGSKRKIPIDDILLDELKPLLKMANPYIFGIDHPLSPTMIDKYFKKGIKKSGVKQIRIHDLRHSHATLLINNGVNIVAVSKRLGHSSINQTLRTYTHLLEKTNDELLNSINLLKNK